MLCSGGVKKGNGLSTKPQRKDSLIFHPPIQTRRRYTPSNNNKKLKLCERRWVRKSIAVSFIPNATSDFSASPAVRMTRALIQYPRQWTGKAFFGHLLAHRTVTKLSHHKLKPSMVTATICVSRFRPRKLFEQHTY